MAYGIIFTYRHSLSDVDDGVERIRRFKLLHDAMAFMSELNELGIKSELWTY